MTDRVDKRVNGWGSPDGKVEEEFANLTFEEKLDLLVGPASKADTSGTGDTFLGEPEIDIVDAVTAFTSKLREQLTGEGIDVPSPPINSYTANSDFAA